MYDIPPGGESVVTAKMDTKSKKGLTRGEFKIHMLYKGKKFVESLAINVNVKTVGKLVSRPGAINLGVLRAGSRIEQSVSLEYEEVSESETKIVNVDAPRWLSYDLKKSNSHEPDGFRLHLIGTAPDIRGEISESVRLFTNNPNYPSLEIPLTGLVIGDIQVSSSNIIKVGRFESGQKLFAVVEFHHRNSSPIVLEKVDVLDVDKGSIVTEVDNSSGVSSLTLKITPTFVNMQSNIIKGHLMVVLKSSMVIETFRIPFVFINTIRR
jgi:hypothetical protein